MSTIRHVVFIEFTKRASPVERSFILFLRYVTSEFLLWTADQVLFLCTRKLTRSLREHGEKNKKSVSSGSPNFSCPRPVSIFDLRQIQCNSLPSSVTSNSVTFTRNGKKGIVRNTLYVLSTIERCLWHE